MLLKICYTFFHSLYTGVICKVDLKILANPFSLISKGSRIYIYFNMRADVKGIFRQINTE